MSSIRNFRQIENINGVDYEFNYYDNGLIILDHPPMITPSKITESGRNILNEMAILMKEYDVVFVNENGENILKIENNEEKKS